MSIPVPAPAAAPIKPPMIAPLPRFFLLMTAPPIAPTPAPITAPFAVALHPFFFSAGSVAGMVLLCTGAGDCATGVSTTATERGALDLLLLRTVAWRTLGAGATA